MKSDQTYLPSSPAASSQYLASVDPNVPKAAVTFSSKPSLKLEIDRASGSKTSLAPPSRPTDSLASHVSGATFASIARAAELQAARARQELRTRPANALQRTERLDSNVSENMPRKGRAWRKLNFSDDTDSKSLPLGKENVLEQTTVSFLADNESTTDCVQESLEPTVHESEQTELFLPDEQHILAPRPNNFLRSRIGEYVSQSTSPSIWDMSSPDPDDMTGTEQIQFIDTSYPAFNIPTESFYPQYPFQYGSNIAFGEGEEEAADAKPDFVTSMHCAPSAYSRTDAYVNNADEFRTTAEEALRSTYPFLNRIGSGGFYDIASTGAVAKLKAKPPHYYPAVKGTRSDIERGVASVNQSDANSHFSSGVPQLARERSDIGNNSSTATAEWNLRHERELRPQFVPASKRASTLTEEEDFELWKNRRVPIVNAASKNVRTDDPVIFGMRMTTDGVVPVHDQHCAVVSAGGRPSRGWYDLLADTHRTDGRGEATTEEPIKVYSHLFARHSPSAQNGPTGRTISATKEVAASELAKLRTREAAERDALRAANFSDDPPAETAPISAIDSNDIAVDLLLPALANLATYQRSSRYYHNDCFNRMGEAPSWCVDHGPDGNNSFFGGDWGTPPARLGRDPRYRLNGRQGAADWGGSGGRRQGRWMR